MLWWLAGRQSKVYLSSIVRYIPRAVNMVHTMFSFVVVWNWSILSTCVMTSSNGSIFRITGHLCGKFTGPRWIPAQRPVTRSFDVFFDLRLNKRLSKQSWGWWFETLSCPLWRHCNVHSVSHTPVNMVRYFTLIDRDPCDETKTKQRTTGMVVLMSMSNFQHIQLVMSITAVEITGKLRITGSLWGESSLQMDSPHKRKKVFLVIKYPCHGEFYLTSVHHRTLQEASNYPWHLIWCW